MSTMTIHVNAWFVRFMLLCSQWRADSSFEHRLGRQATISTEIQIGSILVKDAVLKHLLSENPWKAAFNILLCVYPDI